MERRGRNSITEAVVLKTYRIGEYHKNITFHSPSDGIVRGIAYGAYRGRSKLSGVTDPFGRLKIYLYYEPVKQNYKINDVELIESYDGIRQDLTKFYVASLWAEIVIRSHGGGDEHPPVFQLLTQALGYLDRVDSVTAILIQFLWRYVTTIGYSQDPDRCSECGRLIRAEEVAFVSRGPDIVCEGCAGYTKTPLSPGVRRFLKYSSGVSLDEAMRVGLDPAGGAVAKEALFTLIQNIIEAPLNTLRSSGSML